MRYTSASHPDGREDGRRWLHPVTAINCLSRRGDESTYICGDCGRTEALSDMSWPRPAEGAYPEKEQLWRDEMMRLVVYADRCEGRRLPSGIPWGPSMIPTSGSCVGEDDPLEHRCKCGSLWLAGYVCIDCHTVSPALEALKDHPVMIANEADLQREAEDDARVMRVRKQRQEVQAKRDRIHSRVVNYIKGSEPRYCLNCLSDSHMKPDDYICVRCRASDELAGHPMLAHVLLKLDKFYPSE